MLGRATLTIETSSRVMNPAARRTAGAFQRAGSGRYSSLPGAPGRVEAAEAADRAATVPLSGALMRASMLRFSGALRTREDPLQPPWSAHRERRFSSARVAHAADEHLRRHAVEARRRRAGREALEDLLGLVADAQQVGEAQSLRLALQRGVQAGRCAVVLGVEERHRAAAERAVRVLGGVLEDLLHGAGAARREHDAGGGDGEHPVLTDAVG